MRTYRSYESYESRCIMALGTFIAGRYSCSYDPPGAVAAADMGIMDDGYELALAFAKELIQGTDAYGDSVIDGVYRGGQCFWSGISKEYKAGSLNAALPYNSDAVGGVFAPTGATFLGPGLIGRLDSNIAGILIATATASTPAAASPATLTGTFAIAAENFDLRLAFTSKHRRVPFRLRFLPYLDTAIKWFTTT